jgi:hypothetical protein
MLKDLALRFDKAIKDKFSHKPEVMNYLLKHERKLICIENLADQIIRAEKYSIAIKLSTYDTIIKDVSMMFCKAAIEHIEQQHYSAAKVAQIQRAADHLKEAESMLKDLEKDSLNEKGLTQIERDEIKHAIEKRDQTEARGAN